MLPRFFLFVSLALTACAPQLAAGEPATAIRPALEDCADNIPHPGTIRLYVNEELRVIPYTDYSMPFLGYAGSVDGKECQKYIPVVEVHEYYRDSKGNYVEKDNAYFLTIHMHDIEGKTAYVDGMNEHNR